MMLSSTMRTLIGGTEPLSIPAGREGWSELDFLFLFCLVFVDRGEGACGGGVETLWIAVIMSFAC